MVPCHECPDKPASGLWKITSAERAPYARYLCAQCGLRDYVIKRVCFTPTIRVDLVRSITTRFVAARTEPDPTIPEKHWAEHRLLPEAVGLRKEPLSKLVTEVKRRKAKSSVSTSILDHYRRY